MRAASRPRRAGFAVLTVLLVLLALFALCAPFLMTARNSSQASAQWADRARAELALDAAEREARAVLRGTHPALDATPYADGPDELLLDALLGEERAALDDRGTMWDLEVEDLAGRIDLNTASPGVFANLVGLVTHTSLPVAADDDEVTGLGGAAFAGSGMLRVADELIGYAELDGNVFGRLTRGLLAEVDEEGEPLRCGPSPATTHPAGAVVYDQRTWALVEWRASGVEPRRLDTVDAVVAADPFALTEFDPSWLALFEATCTVYGEERAGPRWQRGTRLTADLEAGRDCELSVGSARWFNPGTLVRIEAGERSELALVAASNGERYLKLTRPVRNEWGAYEAVVRPLARRPVNLNTAAPDVLYALFENLSLANRNARVSGLEAARLVDLVQEERPFDGFGDFVRRLVLPAAGIEPSEPDPAARRFEPFLQEEDALALYANGLNANDARLAFSTMPFSFVTRDTYALELRSTVNAQSGVERLGLVREEVVQVVPQEPLLQLWTRQEDFDLALRLDREAPFWSTGPRSTSQFEGRPHTPASRVAAHFGFPDPDSGARLQVFPSRESGWARLEPARIDQFPQPSCSRHRHFDLEATHPEGRDLSRAPLSFAPDELPVLWRGGRGPGDYLEPLWFSAWIQPQRAFRGGDYLLDVGSTSALPGAESDRVSLTIDDGDLVLRVMDAAADRSDTDFREVGEARYSLTEGAGWPVDTWVHVRADVRGNRPDQMALFVDGRQARTPGLTRLTAPVSDTTSILPVESTEGFPDRCAIRIGNEVLEVEKAGPTGFRAEHWETGERAGRGGRRARARMLFDASQGAWLPYDIHNVDGNHPAGASVQLYGYSSLLASNVSTAQATLPAALGTFAVARLTGFTVQGNDDHDSIAIDVGSTKGAVRVGTGLEISTPDALFLTSADDPEATPAEVAERVMPAFNPGGGFAVIVSASRVFTYTGLDGLTGTTVDTTDAGLRIGGYEFIEYSGWSEDRLFVRQRGVEFPNGNGDGLRAFLLRYDGNVVNSADLNGHLDDRVFVVPVSIPGHASFAPLEPPGTALETPKVAQLTRRGTEAHLTEWVRYDQVYKGQLVRSLPGAMLALQSELTGNAAGVDFGDVIPPDDGGPGGVGQNPGGPPPLDGGPLWAHRLGRSELEDLPLTRAVADVLQFRGVFGTESHAHPAGTLVLPTFRLFESTVADGVPGRGDEAFLLDASATDPGHPVRLQHVHRPLQQRYRPWRLELTENGDDFRLMRPLPAAETTQPLYDDTGEDDKELAATFIYFGLEEAAPLPIGATDFDGSTVTTQDMRYHSRLVLFPSGELPRGANAVAVGGEFGSAARGLPDALIDEVEFGTTEFRAGGALTLVRDLGLNDGEALVEKDEYFVATTFWEPRVLAGLRDDGGLIRIGGEVLAYRDVDVTNGRLVLAPGGRGLLGTDAAAHRAGERVFILESWTATTLTAQVPAGSATLPVASFGGFPDQGTVRIGDELIHYTRRRSGALEMPRASSRPGLDDRQGGGLFRGRYGTAAAGHGAGEVAILHPFRYWDRWAELADAPELAYFGFSLPQPDAFVESVFWQAAETGRLGPRLGLLQRTDPSVPWDADPGLTRGLDLFWEGMPGGAGNRVERSSSQAQWRLFVRYEPGSFDAADGTAHGWKSAPDVTVFGAEYVAPDRRLWSVER